MKKIKKSVFLTVMIICLAAVTAAYAAAGNTVVCSHSWSLAHSEGAPCSGYENTYVCSKCYGTRTETVAPTQTHNWITTYSEAATCEKDGCIQGYCDSCLALKSETIKAFGHSYTYASNNDATCTKDGTKIRKCQICEETDIVPDVGTALGHDFSGEWQIITVSTCKSQGKSGRPCSRCYAVETRIEPLGDHVDKDSDRKCDVCSETLSIFTPTVPDGGDSDNEDCSCNCHKGGLKGFFWKIGNFFCKLFRIKSKQICDCGAEHF